MIELISTERCTGCNICVSICPTNVFDIVVSAGTKPPPVIARGADCQTCFMCELYCPEDALYVAPDADASVAVDESALTEAGVLGSYRSMIGWAPGTTAHRKVDSTFRLIKGF
ncbi:4Fe-4S dicluster domain-containing protein [Pseudochelatococcus contaminans]|uniref:NAD-dependent dihydropyrimidine dehydrogenase PreA subunit n=1 Tax=Pseudochelatococcus contaminans TaxID=1538103 RepID=A0A7W6EHQ7_9HYPH|nr:ferredoxin family protein [Pseudochelatococcus contaminans]MBB3810288.1 NAD-dependent dihydropyrimidine dehydrogenase PreA subunit [Pseudochelatococcus contaminans]